MCVYQHVCTTSPVPKSSYQSLSQRPPCFLGYQIQILDLRILTIMWGNSIRISNWLPMAHGENQLKIAIYSIL